MIRSTLEERLTLRFVQRLCTSTITVERAYLTSDGMGGQTTTWRPMMTVPARLINKADAESVIGDGIQPTATWDLYVHSDAQIQPHDRIRIAGDNTRIFDVVGNDRGQSTLLIQKIGLVERGSW
jgi:head-tail adaptor